MNARTFLVALLIGGVGPLAAAGDKSTIDVRARIDGEVERVHVKVGALVKKGDVLIELDGRLQKIKLEQAEAQLQVAAAILNRHENDFKRAEQLHKSKVISREDYENTAAQKAEAQARLNVARAEVEFAQATANQARVRALIDGTIKLVKVGVGQSVKANELLVKIEATAQVREPDKIKELLKERYDVLTKVVNEQMAGFKAGKGQLQALVPAQRAALEAGLELCETPAERIALLRKDVQLTEEMLRMTELQVKAGLVRQSDALLARAQMLEARIRLLREEAKAKPAKQ